MKLFILLDRIFETKGFAFHKDEKGNRTYTDTNISMFRRVIDAKNKPAITLETAIKGVISMYTKDSITPCVTEISNENKHYEDITNEKLDMLMQALAKQEEQKTASSLVYLENRTNKKAAFFFFLSTKQKELKDDY